jgi:hypothetical protein
LDELGAHKGDFDVHVTQRVRFLVR